MQATTVKSDAPLLSRAEIFVAPADLPEFEAMQSALLREFAPTTEFQRLSLKTLIHSLWTLRRTRILEAYLQERALAAGAIDPLLDPVWGRQLEKVLALRRQAQRDHNRALKDLQSAKRPAPTGNVIPFTGKPSAQCATTYESEENPSENQPVSNHRDPGPSRPARLRPTAGEHREADPASAA